MTHIAFLRSQLPWLVHGSVRQLCFTQLMTAERLCLGLGHINSSISDHIDLHGNPLATLADQRCRLSASGCGVATEYQIVPVQMMIWMVCVELCWFGVCWFGVCRWSHYGTLYWLYCVACRRFQQWILFDQKERTKKWSEHGTGCPKETESLWVMMPAQLYQPSWPRTLSSNKM